MHMALVIHGQSQSEYDGNWVIHSRLEQSGTVHMHCIIKPDNLLIAGMMHWYDIVIATLDPVLSYQISVELPKLLNSVNWHFAQQHCMHCSLSAASECRHSAQLHLLAQTACTLCVQCHSSSSNRRCEPVAAGRPRRVVRWGLSTGAASSLSLKRVCRP